MSEYDDIDALTGGKAIESTYFCVEKVGNQIKTF